MKESAVRFIGIFFGAIIGGLISIGARSWAIFGIAIGVACVIGAIAVVSNSIWPNNAR